MGWLFGYYERRSLIEHLVNGNGLKTIRHCLVGNNLWCVHEYEEQHAPLVRFTTAGEQVTETSTTHRWACLYLLRGNPRVKNDCYNWGYKDIDETMGPNEISFPYTWLDLLTPIASEYANAWRARVKARGEKMATVVPGSKWFYYGGGYTVVARRSPSCWIVHDDLGCRYRMTAKHFEAAELLQRGIQ